jgi:hypothetical protein
MFLFMVMWYRNDSEQSPEYEQRAIFTQAKRTKLENKQRVYWSIIWWICDTNRSGRSSLGWKDAVGYSSHKSKWYQEWHVSNWKSNVFTRSQINKVCEQSMMVESLRGERRSILRRKPIISENLLIYDCSIPNFCISQREFPVTTSVNFVTKITQVNFVRKVTVSNKNTSKFCTKNNTSKYCTKSNTSKYCTKNNTSNFCTKSNSFK